MDTSSSVADFRVWDKESKTMNGVGALHFGKFGYVETVSINFKDGTCKNVAINDCVLMRFSGKECRDLQKIYEYDYVLCSGKVRLVKFKNGSFGIDVDGWFVPFGDIGLADLHNLELRGNYFEER